MKPILVAILAASVFLIPFSQGNTSSVTVQQIEPPVVKILPVKQEKVELVKETGEVCPAVEHAETFLHGTLFLTDF